MISAAIPHTPQSCMAPEMLDENEDARRYNFLVDMWVTEVVTNEMFTDLKGVVLVNISFATRPVARVSTR